MNELSHSRTPVADQPTNANDRFRNMMTAVVGVAGLIWLGLAVFNTRGGGDFPMTGLVMFLVLLAAVNIGRTRRQ